jgi:Fe2+ transport system protein B
MDRLMHMLGLHGKSFLPMIVGSAAPCPLSTPPARWKMKRTVC